MIAETTESRLGVAQGMLQSIVEVCERPGDTADQRAGRSGEVFHSVLAFQPRDPVEIMFAGMAVTHGYLALDSMRDVFRGQEDRLKARTKSTIVALDRQMFGYLRELRLARTRTLPVDEVVQTGDQPDEAPDTVPVIAAVEPVIAPDKPIIAAAPGASHRAPLQTTAPERLASIPRPSRRADTSVVAMLAVLTPANTPRLTGSAAAKPAVADDMWAPASPIEVQPALAMLLRSAAMMPANFEAAAKFHAAVGQFATVPGGDRGELVSRDEPSDGVI
jgi:hypothetical protein